MADSGRFITVDLGAESGRTVLGTIAKGKITLEETHRFPNEPLQIVNRFCWDTIRLFGDIQTGIAKSIKSTDDPIGGIGVDAWGVDFALLDKNDDVLGLPCHYRDKRTDSAVKNTFEIVPAEEIYAATGVQFMQINTLFQLMSLKFAGSPILDIADRLLMTPDLINFWLTGIKTNEMTIASTSQMYNPVSGAWANKLLGKLGLPTNILGPIIQPGSVIGPLHEAVQRQVGGANIQVIAPAAHDTASAVAGAPAESGSHWAYISCGTWSLVGVELDKPVITDQTMIANLTNEGGVNGSTRLLRNVMGLWLLQKCKKSWEQHGSYFSYEQLANMGGRELPFRATVDPDDPLFFNPVDMVEAISEYCKRTGQRPPDGVGPIVRCILESLAMKYRWVIETLEEVTGTPISTIHMIGGGSRNKELCQATADATNRRVLAGPVEATAAGSIIVQAMAIGLIGSLEEGRAMIRNSFDFVEYLPKRPEKWEAPYVKFQERLAIRS